MLFNSSDFLLFFPIVVGLYYIIPASYRYLWLLAASYYFYMQWNPVYVLLLLTSTAVTYLGGIILDKAKDKRKRKICLVSAISINLAILAYFKYANMFVGYLNSGISLLGGNTIPWDNAIILPVGISFFTLQALGYLIDVYRKDIYVEYNFFRYALFISFFPQLVAGPIERSKNLLKQLAVPKKFSYENLRRGLLIMLYGFFLKVVIADRIAIFVDAVYNAPCYYPGFYIVFATMLFAIQIYCDFYGYSTIAKGVALTMGISLMDNFNAPYFSKNIKEFWHRWHISLSTWFRDYLYIPLGGNRKGELRKNINLMIVFLVSGLWHGASMAFVIWGALHGIYQIIETYLRKCIDFAKDKLGTAKRAETFSSRLLHLMITFTLVCFAWIFFRANNTSTAMLVVQEMFNTRNWFSLVDQSMFTLGITKEYFSVVGIAMLVLGLVDYQKYQGKDVVDEFFKQGWWFRTAAIIFMLMFVILFGCYGEAYDVQQFIYFQF